jgi:hypothetical protein
MSSSRSNRPRPNEEMFLSQISDVNAESPVIGPLRVNKPSASSNTPPPAAANPLPYPDDRPRPSGSMPFSSTTGGAPRPHFSASDPNRPTVAGYGAGRPTASTAPPGEEEEGTLLYPDYSQQSFPAPSSGSAAAKPINNNLLNVARSGDLNRFDSTASVQTTRATRGSPPPPETPIIPPPTDIEARFAAAGFNRPAASASPASNAAVAPPSAAAQQRTAQYSTPPPAAVPVAAATPPLSNQPVYPIPQDSKAPVHSPPPGTSITSLPPVHPEEQDLEQAYGRMNVHDEPPPSYASIEPTQGSSPAAFPQEKHRPANIAVGGPPQNVTAAQAVPPMDQHPGFAQPQQLQQQQQQHTMQSPAPSVVSGPSSIPVKSPSPTPSQAQVNAPPPLPEGWMAHLDQGSGQYYYIHMPTQSTQWEFPKGPTPLNLNEPLSPTGTFIGSIASPMTSSFSKQPLASPGLVPQSATFGPDGYYSMASIASPTAAGFTGPPPVAGVDVYRVAPSNGVYFGPYLRYTNMNIEAGIWHGSIMIITNTGQPPTVHIHQSLDLSPNPQQLKASPIYSHERWVFYRYDIDLQMEDQGAKWTYAITSHLGCTRYEFLVAGRHETSWRFIAHSGNDFAMNVNTNQRNNLGGVGYMWKDILQKHIECNGFHTQLGIGDQIFADRMWKEVPLLKEWTSIKGKENRKNAQWTTKHDDDVTHAYFHYYTSHFDQPHLREAWAQIPHVCTLDHHDIFDGYGSYPDYMQQSSVFKNIGRIGVEMYLLFQHHTTHDLLRQAQDDIDLFTITGNGWHFIKFLGPALVVIGPDTRSERTMTQVMAGPTYQGLFPKVALLPASVQHAIWMVPVPIVYPRLESMEHLASTMATTKKVATGTFNMVGKVTSSLAGVVGAKGMVSDGFSSVKKAVGKSGLMSGMLSPFGDIDLLDELRDQWTHESKVSYPLSINQTKH